ncbi:hypothetical protein GGF46_004890 [Coemansia sp. RSA 552]|nr:hypothetical protein GGF46_004890 [Coemansia sp. RSA 552]
MVHSLQDLPKHLVQKIAFSAANWTKADIDGRIPSIGNPVSKIEKYLLLCQNWRLSCLPLFCQEVSITLDPFRETLDESQGWLATVPSIVECNGLRFTRYAHLQIPFMAIASGKALRCFETAGYTSTVFPNVEVVWFKVSKGKLPTDPPNSSTWIERNVDEFVAAVHKMYPSARVCSISSSITFDSKDQHMSQYTSRLFAGLMERASCIKYFAASEQSFSRMKLGAISGLTSVTYSECSSSLSAFLQLLRNNAKTLQTLCLEGLTSSDTLANLVQSSKYSAMVEFSHLETLSVECPDRSPSVSRVDLQGVPFPGLRRLTFKQDYPFTSDALFRGSYQKLVYLVMELSVADVWMLFKQGVFGRGRFPKVCQMEVEMTMDDHQPYNLALGLHIASVLWELAPNVKHLQTSLDWYPYKNTLLETLSRAGSAASLQYLRISYTTLLIDEAIQMLEKLPNLAQLVIDPECIDIAGGKPALRDDSGEQRVAQMFATHYPLAPRLKHVVFGLGMCADMESAAHYAVQLALLCPRLSCVRWASHSSIFVDSCRVLLETPAYAAYQERLQQVCWEKRR